MHSLLNFYSILNIKLYIDHPRLKKLCFNNKGLHLLNCYITISTILKKKEPQIKYDLILRVASVKILHCEMSGLMNNMT